MIAESQLKWYVAKVGLQLSHLPDSYQKEQQARKPVKRAT